MVFAANQEQKNSYTFKDVMFQPENSEFILAMIKYFGVHEARNNWTLAKNSEVKNRHKNKDGKLKTILSIWSSKRNIFPDGKLTKDKSIICEHG